MPGVFRAKLTSLSVVNFLVARGHLEFYHQTFSLHPSEVQAAAMAPTLREKEATITEGQPPAFTVRDLDTARDHLFVGTAKTASPRDRTVCRKEIHLNTGLTPSADQGLLPLP